MGRFGTTITIMLVLLGFSIKCVAQNKLEKTDDFGRIVLSSHIESNVNIPTYAQKVVNNKLTQIASKNGVAGKSIDQRFIITANLVEVSRDITATAPPMIALTLSPTIYIGDAISGELFSSYELPSVKGVGENETKAYMNAVKSININNPAITECVSDGKNKIIAYYNSQIDVIIANANAYAKSGNYDEALYILAAVPNVCKDAYLKAVDKIEEIYLLKINEEGEWLYNEALAQWSSSKTDESAERVVELLSSINPLSKAASNGRKLSENINAFQMQKYKDEKDYIKRQQQIEHEESMAKIKSHADIEKAAIKAAQQVAIARASRPVVYNYHLWY